jgi:hypothetical protein
MNCSEKPKFDAVGPVCDAIWLISALCEAINPAQDSSLRSAFVNASQKLAAFLAFETRT